MEPRHRNFHRCRAPRALETILSVHLRCRVQDNVRDKAEVDKVKRSDRGKDLRWQDHVLARCAQDSPRARNKVDLVHDLVDLVVADLALALKVDQVVPVDLHPIEHKVHDLVVPVQVVDSLDVLVVRVQVVEDLAALAVAVPLLVHSEKVRRSRRSRSQRRQSAKRSTICKPPSWVASALLAVMVRRSDSAVARHFQIWQRR